MYQKIFPLLLLIIISACSFKPKEILIDKNETCKPPKLFDPDNSKITLDGVFIFSDNELNYFYDIKNNEWSCEKPKLNVVNLFDHRSTQRLFGNIKNNHIKKINEIQISMGVNSDFKLLQCNKLSTFMKMNNHSKIDVLKMDIEGAAIDVLNNKIFSSSSLNLDLLIFKSLIWVPFLLKIIFLKPP